MEPVTDNTSTQLPVRGFALARMLVSLVAVSAALGYWGSHQHRPVPTADLIRFGLECGCYNERFNTPDTPANRQKAADSLYPTVREWLESDPDRARRLGAPVSTNMDYQNYDQVQQWVNFSGGRWLTFYSNAGEIYAIKEDKTTGDGKLIWVKKL